MLDPRTAPPLGAACAAGRGWCRGPRCAGHATETPPPASGAGGDAGGERPPFGELGPPPAGGTQTPQPLLAPAEEKADADAPLCSGFLRWKVSDERGQEKPH